ncbi:TetR/AcrR family transcriptional regulator [Inhella sp.]|uniref:TetR/AcrR family transcriptional regulator n=1 Tax=Inhella sp. TaxID=1921806 RepID=UPI0035ADFD02
MRTSKAQQAATRKRLVDTAVRLMSERGYDGTTLKDVAREAGVGDATVYKYFASKERLLGGFFEQALAEALQAWQATPELAQFTLQERLQCLVDAVLEQLRPARAFVALARAQLERAPLSVIGAELPGKALLQPVVERLLDEAEAAGQIAPCRFKAALAGLWVDYLYGLMAFWQQDASAQEAETSELVDLSLELLVLVLQTGLLDRLLALGGFLLRAQMGRWMRRGPDLIDALRGVRAAMVSP